MTITGFVLDGAAGASTEREFAAYRPFSPGRLRHAFRERPAHDRRRSDLSGARPAGLRRSRRGVHRRDARRRAPGTPQFLWARSILKPPAWYARVSRLLREQHPDAAVAVVDPYTFFGLIQQHLGGVQ